MFYKFRNLDWQLVIIPLLLAFVGLLSIYSITGGEGGFFWKQLVILIIGFILYILIALYSRLDFEKISVPLYLVGLFILLFVILFGSTKRGATAWLSIFGVSFEPVELIKFFLIMATAIVFSRYGKMRRSHSIVASLLLLLIPVFLIVKGSEYGTVLVTISAWMTMAIIYNFRFKFIFSIIIAALIGGALTWQFVLDDYKKERVTTFLEPEKDTQGSGYHSYQAKLAIGSGGLFGKGVGQSRQSVLKFLPEPHTDFIFAVIAEEWGFVGVGILISLMVALWIRLVILVRKMTFTTFQSLTIIGFWALLLTQSFINVGMNLGLLPITGIPLPFISYGGSSLLSSLIALGIIQNFVCQYKSRTKIVS